MNTTPGRWSRRHVYRFGLLMALVGATFGGYWCVQHRNANAARSVYLAALRDYEAASATCVDVCEASLRLCEAEEDVPLASGERARALHLARVYELYRGARAAHDDATDSTLRDEAARLERGRVRDYLNHAQDWFGDSP